jgi:putative hydrolase of HD superfamily
MKNLKRIINFFFELIESKRTPRSGWQRIGIKHPESIAEHICVSSQIAYILGKMEGVNAERAALISLFHDIGEIRTGDANWVSKIYWNSEKAEEKALLDQIKNLPGEKEIKGFLRELKEQKTPESIVVKDADYLEVAIQAKCYLETGHKDARLWMEAVRSSLKTKSAKKLFSLMQRTNLRDWWLDIKEIQNKSKKLGIKNINKG